MSWGREMGSWKEAPSEEEAFFNMSLQRESYKHKQLTTRVTRVFKRGHHI